MAGLSGRGEQASVVKRGVEDYEVGPEALPACIEQGHPSREAAGRARLAVGRRRGKQRMQQRYIHRPKHRHLLRLWHT